LPDDKFETKYLPESCYEQVPDAVLDRGKGGNCLSITDLKKTYSNGFKAVNGVNLKMFTD
jgi:ATP-binding cassette, subfamily A (ABC1), member 3